MPLLPTEPADSVMFSVVVPVYRNRETLATLISRLESIANQLPGRLEAVFVVDGSPDDSHDVLLGLLPKAGIPAQLLEHSRNFGAFNAIRTGIGAARGEYVGVMAADLQEPPELMLDFFRVLAAGHADVAVGRREGRDDPVLSGLASRTYWNLYRRFVIHDLPRGGVDVFAVNRRVVEQLLQLEESHSSLVGLLFWVGFRRVEVPYSRLAREHGKSGWTFTRKLRYLTDSVFSFTDLPVRMLTSIGAAGSVLTTLAGLAVFVSWSTGRVVETGYTPIMLAVLLSAFVVLFGLGVVGSYVWRIYENSKRRPNAIVKRSERFGEPAA